MTPRMTRKQDINARSEILYDFLMHFDKLTQFLFVRARARTIIDVSLSQWQMTAVKEEI